MVDRKGCIACDLTHGRLPLPGGVIWESDHWRVEHCVGPLGVGTLLVKPTRHVERVADLTAGEAAEMGPVLHRASRVVGDLTNVSQVYVCLWSHGPSHIHFVVQPETESAVEAFGTWGPSLQAAMFAREDVPDPVEVERFAELARRSFDSWLPPHDHRF